MKKAPAPTFKDKLWTRLESIILILVTDIVLFLIVLAALLIAYAAINGLKALGMSESRLELLETIHWYAYLAVSTLFLFDMLVKTLMELFKSR
jgi:hypothetical protein